jgi:hypothetical protein
MLTFDAAHSSDSSSHHAGSLVAAQVTDLAEPAAILNCSRLGRSANPPGFSLSDWLRDRRRR